MNLRFAVNFCLPLILAISDVQSKVICSNSTNFMYQKCEILHVNFLDLQLSSNLNLKNFNPALIETLSFHASTLHYFPKNLFLECSSLSILYMDLSDLKFIEQSSFKGAENLERFYARMNDLKVLEPNLFEYARNLEIIDLSSNLIDYVNEETFEGLENLEILSLATNFIKKLKPDTFETLVNLRELNLQHNRIEKLDEYIFANNSRLEFLNLEGNQIKIISFDMFEHLRKLKFLNLYGNFCNFDSGNNITDDKIFVDCIIGEDKSDPEYLLFQISELKEENDKLKKMIHKSKVNLIVVFLSAAAIFMLVSFLLTHRKKVNREFA